MQRRAAMRAVFVLAANSRLAITGATRDNRRINSDQSVMMSD
jgi:hypothetical protein